MERAAGSASEGRPATGRVLSVNVGVPRPITAGARTATSAIWKGPVPGRVAVRGVNLAGDDQADRSVHGGEHKAVYSYAAEDNDWWASELGRAVPPGTFGENLTVAGVDVTGAVIGERWRVGSTLLEVSEPRLPCWKLTARMDEQGFQRRFTAAGRFGAYLRIVTEGDVGAGDEVEVLDRPDHGVTIGDVGVIYSTDRHRSRELLAVPQLSDEWHTWARQHG